MALGTAIGIDFGYSDIKMVQLEKIAGGYSLQNIGKKPLLNDIAKFDPETIGKSHWVLALQELCKELKINPKRAKNVVSSLSGTNVSIREVTTLEMSEDEMMSSLEFEAKKHIPMDGTHAILDFHVIGSDSKELDKLNVLLVATTKNLITHHNEIMQEVGFKHGLFDADPIALVNTYSFAEGLTPEGIDVLLNIGNQTTTLVVWGVNQKFFTRELNFGGHHFTKAAAKNFDVSYAEGEQIKIEKGVDSVTATVPEKKDTKFVIKVAEKTIYTNLAEDIRKTLRYYMKTSGQAHFNKFYLSGGSAILPGLKDFLAKTINVEFQILNPFSKIENVTEIDNPAQYNIALGCAIRGLEK